MRVLTAWPFVVLGVRVNVRAVQLLTMAAVVIIVLVVLQEQPAHPLMRATCAAQAGILLWVLVFIHFLVALVVYWNFRSAAKAAQQPSRPPSRVKWHSQAPESECAV